MACSYFAPLLVRRQQYCSFQSLSPLIISHFSDRTTRSNTKIGSGRARFTTTGTGHIDSTTLVSADCVRDRRYSQSSRLDVLRLGQACTVKPDYLLPDDPYCRRPSYLRDVATSLLTSWQMVCWAIGSGQCALSRDRL